MIRYPLVRHSACGLLALLAMVCVMTPCLGQSRRFESMGAVDAFTPDSLIRGRRNGVFAIEKGRLVRGPMRDAVETATGESPGDVHDLAADPAGPVFVAAERGLFVISRDVPYLDRVASAALVEGEAVLAVHVDEARRVWFLTPKRLGCLEAAYHHGRSRTVADGLPDEAWIGFRAVGRGLVLITKSGDGFRYVPAEESRPAALTITTVNGSPAPGAPVALTHGQDLVIALDDGEDVDLYHYVDDHQVLRRSPKGEVVVRGIPPGRHVVSVVGLDADLRRTKPATVTVEVAMPTYAKPVVLLGGLGGGVLVIFGAFLTFWKRKGGGRGGLGRAVLSATICTVLAMQVVAGLFPHGRGWPFVGYSMYTSVFEPLATTHRVDLRAILPDGRMRGMNAQGFDIAMDSRWQIMRPIIHGDRAERDRLLDRYNAKNPKDEIRGFQVLTRRYRLTERGPRRVATLVLAHHERAPR